MKKCFSVLIAVMIIITCCTGAFAKSGDIVGEYYSTDIKTYVNDLEIDAINIGGWTLISAEDMQFCGFSILWSPDTRELYVNRGVEINGQMPPIEHSGYAPGTVLGNYYETDIVTYLDGTPITAYNIGGRTYIWAEQMRDFGYTVDWNEADRTLAVLIPDRAGYDYSIFLHDGENPGGEYSDGKGAFSVVYNNGQLTGSGDAKLFTSRLNCNGKNYTISMVFYQNAGLFYSTSLTHLMNSLSYNADMDNPVDPREKYNIVNENVTVIINGHKSEKVSVFRGRGNGHVDYMLEISDIPMFKEDEITDIYFSVGNTDGMEAFDMPDNRPEF